MKKNNMFFEWFKALGGNVNAIKTEEVNEILNPPIFKVSTLKTRATEIKEKHNHKFNFNRV